LNKIILPIVIITILFSSATLSSIPFAIAGGPTTPLTLVEGQMVLSIEPEGFPPFMNRINPNTGATISQVEITLDDSFPPDFEVNAGVGIEFNPGDSKIYALLSLSPDPGGEEEISRHLATIDPLTGIATLVGDTGERKIANLAFNPGTSGTMYSVILKTSFSPDRNTLATISTVDGSVVPLCDLVRFDGTSLAFNGDDVKLYYATDGVFQRINDFNVVGDCDVTDIAISSVPSSPTGLIRFNSFLIVEGQSTLSSISNAQYPVLTFIGNLDDNARDLTFIDRRGVGGELISIDTTALLLAGVQTNLAWMIPIAASAVGIGLVLVKRKF